MLTRNPIIGQVSKKHAKIRFYIIEYIKKIGAGEEIRTLDPNLGKDGDEICDVGLDGTRYEAPVQCPIRLQLASNGCPCIRVC